MKDPVAYEHCKAPGMHQRYLPPQRLEEFLMANLPGGALHVLGHSVEQRPVYGVTLGRGPVRVLMWSQMHGNESTTTWALLDLINGFCQNAMPNPDAFQFLLIPMLNPDGAYAYTRKNAKGVDLNRDARGQTQPESRILRSAYNDFAPHYCFNLHDQRTIFSAGDTPLPATLSFLAPAANDARDWTESREEAARLIAEFSCPLRQEIGIGRYDDTFNPDCVGDFFQAAGTPTVLFEAGHYPGDYQREQTRYYAYRALMNALESIQEGSHKEVPVSAYLEIPENRQRFLDILIDNAHLLNKAYAPGTRIGLQYSEVLQGGHVHFRPAIVEKDDLEDRYGHQRWDAANPDDLRALKASEGLLKLFPGTSG